MRRLLLTGALLLLGACRSAQVNTAGATGARNSRDAIEAFLDAARAGDVQALTKVWGSEKGAARDRLTPDELEKRAIIMVCHLKSDSYEFLGDRPADDGQRVARVELRRGDLRRTTSFWTVQGPGDRWYVADADLKAVQDFASRDDACPRSR